MTARTSGGNHRQTKMNHNNQEPSMQKTTNSSNISRAQRLISEYSTLLHDVSDMLMFGAPETLLPASKDEIRQSIHAVASHFGFQGMAEMAAFGELRIAYMALANFIPYEEANSATRLRTAFSHNDQTYLASPEAQQIMARVRRMEGEAARLGAEFDRLGNSEAWNQIDDINALIAELSIKQLPPQPG